MNKEQKIGIDKDRSETVLLVISLAIFLLNDFIFFYNFYPWVYYAADYALKSVIIIGIFLTVKKEPSSLRYFKIPKEKIPQAIGWTFCLILAGLIIDQGLWRFLGPILPPFPWDHYFPVLENPLFNLFDLTIGILMVAVTEEYVYRYLIINKLRIKLPENLTVIIAALIFGLAHWSFGFVAIIVPFLWGLISMASVKKTETLIPAMIAHYVIDVVGFSRVLEEVFS